MAVLPVSISCLATEGRVPAWRGDPFLDNFVGSLGNWEVERKFADGRTAKLWVRAEWVLQDHFVQLHYTNLGQPRTYEATLLVGVDRTRKRYICHWTDHLGGDFSADGFAVRDRSSNVMEFKFAFPDYAVVNRFVYDPKSHRWKSTVGRTEKGEWKIYCEDTFTPTY